VLRIFERTWQAWSHQQTGQRQRQGCSTFAGPQLELLRQLAHCGHHQCHVSSGLFQALVAPRGLHVGGSRFEKAIRGKEIAQCSSRLGFLEGCSVALRSASSKVVRDGYFLCANHFNGQSGPWILVFMLDFRKVRRRNCRRQPRRGPRATNLHRALHDLGALKWATFYVCRAWQNCEDQRAHDDNARARGAFAAQHSSRAETSGVAPPEIERQSDRESGEREFVSYGSGW